LDIDCQNQAEYFIRGAWQIIWRYILRAREAAAIEADKSIKMTKFFLPMDDT
jgi:hypothetical protein